MALTSCPECHREVSDQADSCPHCGHPLRRPAPLSPAAVDEQISERLASEGKIAAIKCYREHTPGASLLEAKEYVERLEAARPFDFSAPKENNFGGNLVGCLYLLIALLLGLVLWVIEPRVHRAWEENSRSTPTPVAVSPTDSTGQPSASP